MAGDRLLAVEADSAEERDVNDQLCTKLHAVNVAMIAKFRLDQQEKDLYFAAAVLKNKAVAVKDDLLLVVETDLAETDARDLVPMIDHCMTPLAQNVEKNAKCLFSHQSANQYFAMTVLKEAEAKIQEKYWIKSKS